MATTVIMLLLSALSIAPMVASSAMSAVGKKRLQPKINALADQIRKDSDLLSKLQEAYQKKDLKLAESLVLMSPFGSGYSKLRKERSKLEQDYESEKKQITDRIQANESKLDSANQSLEKSGSIVSGMIESEKYPTDKNVSQFDPMTAKPGEANRKIAENNEKYSAPTSIGPRGTYNATPFSNAQRRSNNNGMK